MKEVCLKIRVPRNKKLEGYLVDLYQNLVSEIVMIEMKRSLRLEGNILSLWQEMWHMKKKRKVVINCQKIQMKN